MFPGFQTEKEKKTKLGHITQVKYEDTNLNKSLIPMTPMLPFTLVYFPGCDEKPTVVVHC